MSIDLGINNLCTVSSNCINSFIIDGRKLKSINQHWNKRVSNLKSKLVEGKYWSKLLSNITNIVFLNILLIKQLKIRSIQLLLVKINVGN